MVCVFLFRWVLVVMVVVVVFVMCLMICGWFRCEFGGGLGFE